MMRCKEPGWVKLTCPDGRRGVGMRVTDGAVELCAGREGDDAYVEFRIATIVVPEQLTMVREILDSLAFAKELTDTDIQMRAMEVAQEACLYHKQSNYQDPEGDGCPECGWGSK